jgi:hypothetical protein
MYVASVLETLGNAVVPKGAKRGCQRDEKAKKGGS